MVKFDELDLKILSELINDANISIPKLSEKIEINASVIYSRIKRLINQGLIKRYTLEINDDAIDYKILKWQTSSDSSKKILRSQASTFKI